MTTRPSISLDGAVWPNLVLDLRCYPMLRPAVVVDLFVFVLQLNSDAEVDDFQAEGPINNEVTRLDIPVSD